ncbi:hypothetical protein KXD93_19800 [Mucilaginibacter sp. BJC16-A38]|uniref:hypothetical protein n=1 Tax=Mucilaginibacter phenanthrenivorans TaxID=1234842 RepID=UPI002157BBCA|nr:hypothetical protein [Mucilaginibacter phenanthrenivorans]MCR8559905.1 hypothetical protein [Mucilaginibacter phenanthrenivorans]
MALTIINHDKFLKGNKANDEDNYAINELPLSLFVISSAKLNNKEPLTQLAQHEQLKAITCAIKICLKIYLLVANNLSPQVYEIFFE